MSNFIICMPVAYSAGYAAAHTTHTHPNTRGRHRANREYDHHPKPGSPEAEIMELFKNPRDWV
jgi:hypothetical protein